MGTNWWGYAQGDSLMLTVVVVVFVVFTGAYLAQRLGIVARFIKEPKPKRGRH